jgi:hypothetical protein
MNDDLSALSPWLDSASVYAEMVEAQETRRKFVCVGCSQPVDVQTGFVMLIATTVEADNVVCGQVWHRECWQNSHTERTDVALESVS